MINRFYYAIFAMTMGPLFAAATPPVPATPLGPAGIAAPPSCPPIPFKEMMGEKPFPPIGNGRDGVTYRVGTEEYISIPDKFFNFIREKSTVPISPMAIDIAGGKNVDGIFEESPNRVTYVLRVQGSEDLILATKWRFKRDGAIICRAKDSFNAQILNSPASITLIESPPEATQKTCLWKVDVVHRDSVQFEFWVKDICAGQKPSRSKLDIIKLITNLRQMKA